MVAIHFVAAGRQPVHRLPRFVSHFEVALHRRCRERAQCQLRRLFRLPVFLLLFFFVVFFFMCVLLEMAWDKPI